MCGFPPFVNSISCFLMSSIKWLSATVPGIRFGDVAVVTGYERTKTFQVG